MSKAAPWVKTLPFLMALALLGLAACGKDAAPIGPPGAGGGARFLHTRPEVSISHMPKLNEPYTVTGIFTALKDNSDVELWLEAGVYLDGEPEWHGPMTEGEVKTLSATFVFLTEGNHVALAEAYSPSTVPSRHDSIPINMHVTKESGRLGGVIGKSRGYSFGPGDPPIALAGDAFVVETTLALNTSDRPRVEFLQSRDDVERLQAEGLFPQKLRYRWRTIDWLDFSKFFAIAYFDALRPETGHLVAFNGREFELRSGVLEGTYKTFTLPTEVSGPTKSVSVVEVRGIARRDNPPQPGFLAFQGTQTFEFTADGQALGPMTVDLKAPSAESPVIAMNARGLCGQS